jgi:bifunctional UDP-N-acetylglucosamine pyrophosphorylase/glucosamine-1-phosphate N-acetyltransferase
MKNLNIIILAAGKGTRMHSSTPKVLHAIGGQPILNHVLDCANKLNPSKIIIVYGFGGEVVKTAITQDNIIWVEQVEQKGTGHAVQQAIDHLNDSDQALIMLGDVPLVNASECSELIESGNTDLAIMTLIKEDPTGYGRIVRASSSYDSKVLQITEQKDASSEQQLIKEVNTGIMAMPNKQLKSWLLKLENNNAQGEFYLTDIVKYAVDDKLNVATVTTSDEYSVTGINSKKDLEIIERAYQTKNAEQLLFSGVTLKDKSRIDVRGTLNCGKDVIIDVNCIFEGKVTLGDNVSIGPNCVIKNASIETGTKIAAFTHIDDASVGGDSKIGPFARLRPGAKLASNTHIGNFVEIKNAEVGVGSKVNHLSYIGDSVIGKSVNIGAGTITCNYDGQNKFKTIIEDNAFIGSDTQLVAPVTIGRGATIAAGSTITKDAPSEQLTLCRAKAQKSIPGWKRPVKIKKEQ